MLCYIIYRTGYDGYHINVFTSPRFYLWKATNLECIQISRLGLVNGHCYKLYNCIVIVVMQIRCACYFLSVDGIRACANGWFTLRRKFTFKRTSPTNQFCTFR